jgi:hypothetical protein
MKTAQFIDSLATLATVGLGSTIYVQPRDLTQPQVAYAVSTTVPFDDSSFGDMDVTLVPFVLGFQGNILVESVGE